jgi:trans-aconitate methyltransferase
MAGEAEQIVDLYRRHAQTWVSDRGTHLFEKVWLDRFLSLMPANPKVLDIGCGSGEPIARYLISHSCAVTAVDSAPEMIALFRKNFPTQTSHVADMRTLSLSSLFNGILVWNSFFHLSHNHQRRMFPIFREHAAPRATLMFTSGSSHGEAIGSFAGEPLYHASLDTAEYNDLLNSNGFEVVKHVVSDPDCGSSTIWLAQRK